MQGYALGGVFSFFYAFVNIFKYKLYIAVFRSIYNKTISGQQKTEEI